MLHVHRSERADALVEVLGDLLLEPPKDPMVPEVISVPTRGVERWLTQMLSLRLGVSPGRTDGICGNVEFPFPGRMLERAARQALGASDPDDPWSPSRAVWPLLDVIEEGLGENWLQPLATHLGSGHDPEVLEHRRDRRFGTARHLADLFDRYAVHRPRMLRAWADGRDVDPADVPLPAAVVWQAELWRRLGVRIGHPSPAERLADACSALRGDRTLSDLPERLSIFGLTRLPAVHLDLLTALGEGRDVHLFLLHPSPALWGRIEAKNGEVPVGSRSDDPTATLPEHPLLASWGRDAREMQLTLGGAECWHSPQSEPPPTLLGTIQADIRANRRPPGAPDHGAPDERVVLDDDDRSVQIHACHGRARQVEVVRDAVLHLLAKDPTLEPRDVIVMCPDIEAFAPLIEATFGAAAAASGPTDNTGDRPPDLRVRLADRSLRQTNPILGAVSELLRLATARATATEVLDLAAREPVRRRFGFDDEDLETMEEWAESAGVRWGLDAEQRAPFGLGNVDANTWDAGLDRVLLGVAMSEDDARLVGGVLPLDGVEPGSVDLVGRMAEFVSRLRRALRSLEREHTLNDWVEVLSDAASLLMRPARGAEWQRAELDEILAEIRAAAAGGGDQILRVGEVRALLGDRLRGRPTRAGFRTGHLTVCTLVPMRSVPHRVVCLLGLDDGAFPRGEPTDGDDIVLLDPHVGDRDPRGEDRQLLLDAVMAAGEHLVITYSGHDVRTNAARPPAVPVGELLDVVDQTARLDGDRSGRARERVIFRHPLQSFDPRNFRTGDLMPGGPWGFDPVARDGAAALIAERDWAPPFLDEPLEPEDLRDVSLQELIGFVQAPVRHFLRNRLGVWLPGGDDDGEPLESIPIELSYLQSWGVGERLLLARLSGIPIESAIAAERARGLLPPGKIGDAVLKVARDQVAVLLDAVDEASDGAESTSVEIDLALSGGTRLSGTVPSVHGDRIIAVSNSRLAPRRRLETWVRLLAMSAAHPERPVSAVTIGRARKSRDDPGASMAWIEALAPAPATRRAAAEEELGRLLDLRARGLCEAVPIFCKTSGAYAEAVNGGEDPDRALADARSKWETGDHAPFPNEDGDHAHVLAVGESGLDLALSEEPTDDEHGEGWAADEEHRFGRYARRLWDPLLAREEIEDR